MDLIQPTSLHATLEAVNDVFLRKQRLSSDQESTVLAWLAARQCSSGAYEGYFMPLSLDRRENARLYTGERLHTSLALSYIPMLETARALKLFSLQGELESRALARVERRIHDRCFTHFCAVGECAPITIAYMRYLNAQRSEPADQVIACFLKRLTESRNGSGRWKGFPFYYTLLMLNELDLPLANEERSYARRLCENLLARPPEDHVLSWRRRMILSQALKSGAFLG